MNFLNFPWNFRPTLDAQGVGTFLGTQEQEEEKKEVEK